MWNRWLSAGGLAVVLIAGVKCADCQEVLSHMDDRLVVHEWGTFTTFSGSNGVHLDFRPLRDQDLPDFVMNRASQSGHIWFGKGRIRTRVRMETPVTYFYTEKERTVRASVEFPKGLLTEFYPPVAAMAPTFDSTKAFGVDGEPVGNSKLDWGEINLIPESSLAPGVNDRATSEWLRGLLVASVLPSAGDNHYIHARNTDSALVHVRIPPAAKDGESPAFTAVPRGNYIEKFLFYRGVGKFDVPVKVSAEQNDRIEIVNLGRHVLKHMLLLQVNGENRTYSMLPDVTPGQGTQTKAPAQAVSLDCLREIVCSELVDAGLYEKEAQAMVDTWTDSWFTEEGTRLFYFVPQEITDSILPLTITPEPDETLRVMVGRVEIMSASREQRLLAAVLRSAKERADKAEQQKAVGTETAVELPVPPEFVALGRLAEPALCRLREISTDRTAQIEVDCLIARMKADLAAEGKAAQLSAQLHR